MDWDNDGKLDIIAGNTRGHIWFFKNEGTAESPKFAKGSQLEVDGETIAGWAPKIRLIRVGPAGSPPRLQVVKEDPNESKGKDYAFGLYSKVHVVDFNGDGLLDILVGHSVSGKKDMDIVVYRNIGTKDAPKLAAPEPLDMPGPKMSRPSPYVVDLDGDGVRDLLCGTEKSEVYFFRNTGTNTKPKFAEGEKLDLNGGEDFEKGTRCRIDVVDWNNDGKLDLLVGNRFRHKEPTGGNIWLFKGK